MHRLALALAGAAVALAIAASPAAAVPPPNDGSATPAGFEPYTTNNGAPAELQATAELAEATPDADAFSCLGPSSFARSVWYRIDGATGARELTVEASGRTLALVDLAAYVQGQPGGPFTLRTPNACAGAGAGGGADEAEDRTSALTIRVPPGHAVLLQVGRRGPVSSPDDERVQLALAQTPVPPEGPTGDRAGRATPLVPRSGREIVNLSGATTTQEDPATPSCASQGSVWRRVRPRKTRAYNVVAQGVHVGSMAIFRGSRPTRGSFVDCIDREGNGPLTLRVRAQARRQLWVRLGTDRPPVGARARLLVGFAAPGPRSSGGGCLGMPRARVSGVLVSPGGRPRAANRARDVRLSLRVRGGPVCDAELRLVGPGNRIYARARGLAVRGSGQIVSLPRTRRLVRGLYRLRIEGSGLAGVRGPVRSTVAFRLR